jgi:hypothetical protein
MDDIIKLSIKNIYQSEVIEKELTGYQIINTLLDKFIRPTITISMAMRPITINCCCGFYPKNTCMKRSRFMKDCSTFATLFPCLPMEMRCCIIAPFWAIRIRLLMFLAFIQLIEKLIMFVASKQKL